MKKVLYTLNIDNYAPEITAMTYPLIQKYAKRIGASLEVISERKFPEFPPVYEKLQIYELGKNNDWNIYVDGDALIHPDLFDVTEHLRKDTVLHNGNDLANQRWKYDRFFYRDGRHIGSCNWFTVGSDWCIDLWKPLDDLTLQEAVSNITLTLSEQRSSVMSSDHLIDDYTLSRNIAKYGLNFETFIHMKERLGDRGEYLWHMYAIPEAEKIRMMREVLLKWGVLSKPRVNPCAIEGWMLPIEIDWLCRNAAQFKSIVEVGSWKGRSTAALLNATTGTVFAVDHFQGTPSELNAKHAEAKTVDIFGQFLDNVGRYPNLQVLKMSSEEAATRFPDGSAEMVFLDADHTEEGLTVDLETWLPKCSKLLCGHDVELEPVRKALENVGIKWQHAVGTIWYAKLAA